MKYLLNGCKIWLFACAIQVLILLPASAKIFYVAKKGSDKNGDGTTAHPWLSLPFAIKNKALNPGDLIQLSAGVFILSEPLLLPTGISLRGLDEHTVITGNFYFQIADTDYHHHSEKFLIQVPVAADQSISNLVLDGQSRQLHGGLFIGKSERTLVTHLMVRDFNWSGIWLFESNQCEVSYIKLFNNAYQHKNNSTGNLQIFNAADLKLHHNFIKETRWAYGIKTYTIDWTTKDWWNAAVGRITNLEISDNYIDVPELGGWVVPETDIHAPDIAIELQGVDLLGVNIHHNWLNNHISAVLKRWSSTGQTVHIHHNIFDIHRWGYAIELNQDYVEVDHNLFFGGQHPFAQWQGDRTNKKMHIHHNYIAGLNTAAGYNGIMRWVGGIDSLVFNNNTIVFETSPKNPLFYSERENAFSNTTLRNNIFINLTDTTRSSVFYNESKGLFETNFVSGFTDFKNNISRNDFATDSSSGYPVLVVNRNSVLDNAGSSVGYATDKQLLPVGAFSESELWQAGPDRKWRDAFVNPFCRLETTSLTNLPVNLKVNDVFKLIVKNKVAPNVIDTIETTVLDDAILITKIHFQSIVDAERANLLYAMSIRPMNKKNLPAILILHGGTQTADDYRQLGIDFAKRGYAVLIPDLPGITSPDNANRNGKGSSGNWTNFNYGAKHFETNPSVVNSSIYEGVVAAVQAFYLLKNQTYVNPHNVGIRGLSWGGYTATITTALLGKQVKAGFAVYGSGFYDLPSYFKSILDNKETDKRNAWLAALDAGRYADRIQSPFYFMAASNDTYFHPPAVMATYDKIKGVKNILFAPNNDHQLTGVAAPDSTEFWFFDFHLKKKGKPLPAIENSIRNVQGDSSLHVEFEMKSETNISEAIVWYSTDEKNWTNKRWKPSIAMKVTGNRYRALLPNEVNKPNGYWFIVVTDERMVSVGTKIYTGSSATQQHQR